MLVPVRPPSKYKQARLYGGPALSHNLFRDNFTISTWLLLGAIAQGLVCAVVPLRYAIWPAVLMLSWGALESLLATLGWKENQQMKGVVLGKFSAQIPDREGEFADKPSGHGVVLILLSARSNHPLGILGPGYKQVGDYMTKMQSQLAKSADKFGYLGHTSWIEANGRTTANTVMTATYFRTVEELHLYAHSPLHKKVWRWWNSIAKTHPHLSINHELYHAPENCWETIYANCHPLGMAATETKVKVADGPDGPEYQWVGSMVDASRGGMRSQTGRMNLSDGSDNANKYGVDPYAAPVMPT
ncbi:hypothetical protein BDV12DRAFT_17429 [Aspergillus spectabilis]